MTTVLFRKEKEGDIIAVFPYIQEAMACLCYTHFGQHFTADWLYLRNHTTQASEKEAQKLINELQAVGYDDLRIIKRLPNWYAIHTRRVAGWE